MSAASRSIEAASVGRSSPVAFFASFRSSLARSLSARQTVRQSFSDRAPMFSAGSCCVAVAVMRLLGSGWARSLGRCGCRSRGSAPSNRRGAPSGAAGAGGSDGRWGRPRCPPSSGGSSGGTTAGSLSQERQSRIDGNLRAGRRGAHLSFWRVAAGPALTPLPWPRSPASAAGPHVHLAVPASVPTRQPGRWGRSQARPSAQIYRSVFVADFAGGRRGVRQPGSQLILLDYGGSPDPGHSRRELRSTQESLAGLARLPPGSIALPPAGWRPPLDVTHGGERKLVRGVLASVSHATRFAVPELLPRAATHHRPCGTPVSCSGAPTLEPCCATPGTATPELVMSPISGARPGFSARRPPSILPSCHRR